mmetsp:Transcript_2105/g.1403  ORF Transcript_2105/g.1403 Transcript_2105/m.1403 type:complete len:178 (+) Transcript_2105:577-1110(+)|eukprot:CAMPEP_0201283382 /NCGR_PEP_ID=MMETSP1317-20130820/8403_1 /ASSEMBLY_ACC=CAM_ASM_000770 /TAXON_ID=187299 /ORGANISM="Undescribed Undescribed, Strain Undescribed" /LENGTH=177 /DNA_ID=CAMNT_0047599435 /DNA_START=192 /DNA_END=725 /DNA_ORIENTATION=-
MLKYPLCSYSPFIAAQKAVHEKFTTPQLTTAVFEPINMMLQCDPRSGKYMACCLMYRGDVAAKDVNSSISVVKSKEQTIQFVPWCPTGFKVGITNATPTVTPGGDIAKTNKSCMMIANTTAVGKVWAKVYKKFMYLHSSRAFEYSYLGEGMESGEFAETKECLDTLLQTYVEAGAEA